MITNENMEFELQKCNNNQQTLEKVLKKEQNTDIETSKENQKVDKITKSESIINNNEGVNSIIETCKKCEVKKFKISTGKNVEVKVGVSVITNGGMVNVGVDIKNQGNIGFEMEF